MPISLKDDYSIKFNSHNSKDGTSIYTFGHPSGAEWVFYDEGYISLRRQKNYKPPQMVD